MGRIATIVLIALLLGQLAGIPCSGQSSTSYRLSDYTFNSGGHPDQGTVMFSPNYRVTLDALGDGVVGPGLGGGAYRMDASFGACYPPPGEVRELTFTDQQSLEWHPERSVGDYNLYRDSMSALSGLGYGACVQQHLAGAATSDTDTPPSGDGYFYLATAENRLGEEGPKGIDSSGAPRQGTVCP